MKKIDIEVPKEVCHLSEWQDFDDHLPRGQVMVNKSITGCGFTSYYLTNSQAVLLTSPRTGLINSKMMEYGNRLHYFSREADDNGVREDLSVSIGKLGQYLSDPSLSVPKILVTYDSLPIVLHVLHHNGCLGLFTIVVDEATALFTDAKFKGSVDLTLLHCLHSLPNHIVYVSATPLSEPYYDEIDEFKNMPYYRLVWDASRKETVYVRHRKMTSTRSAIREIISRYKKDGYFDVTYDSAGNPQFSKEAVFYLNNFNEIGAVIKQCGLTPNDTMVICSRGKEPELKRMGFSVGMFPPKASYKTDNKTFTFVTRASFEGADHYSDNASCYVFADSNKECLSLDISIDLWQIIGRCRTSTNPFRTTVNLYYIPLRFGAISEQDARELVRRKCAATEQLFQFYGTATNMNVLGMLKDGQLKQRYQKNYIDVLDSGNGFGRVVINKLVYLADARAIDIQYNQYKNTFHILRMIDGSDFVSQAGAGLGNPLLEAFIRDYFVDGDFSRRMKLYCDTVGAHPELKEAIEQIPEVWAWYKIYYNTLGSAKICALAYRELRLKVEYSYLKSDVLINEKVKATFNDDQFYTKKEVKEKLSAIYKGLGLSKCAKAKDIETILPNTEEVHRKSGRGIYIRGYLVKLQ